MNARHEENRPFKRKIISTRNVKNMYYSNKKILKCMYVCVLEIAKKTFAIDFCLVNAI